MSGPYATEGDALADLTHLPAGPPIGTLQERADFLRDARAARLRLLTDACSTAGVEVGEFDRRVLEWLTGWEPTTVQVVADLIQRAYRSGTAAT